MSRRKIFWAIALFSFCRGPSTFGRGCEAYARLGRFKERAAKGARNEQFLAQAYLDKVSEEAKFPVRVVGPGNVKIILEKENSREKISTVELHFGNEVQHKILLREEKQRDGTVAYDRGLLLAALGELPTQTMRATTEITITRKNPGGDARFLGKAEPGKVWIHPARAYFLAQTLLHEHAHNVALGIYRGWAVHPNSEPGRAWRVAMAKDSGTPSNYGDKNIAEDFAEAFSIYLEERGGLRNFQNIRYRWPHRCAILDKVFSAEADGNEFWSQIRTYYRLQELKRKGSVGLAAVGGVGTLIWFAYRASVREQNDDAAMPTK